MLTTFTSAKYLCRAYITAFNFFSTTVSVINVLTLLFPKKRPFIQTTGHRFNQGSDHEQRQISDPVITHGLDSITYKRSACTVSPKPLEPIS